jgi:hypothetical protein
MAATFYGQDEPDSSPRGRRRRARPGTNLSDSYRVRRRRALRLWHDGRLLQNIHTEPAPFARLLNRDDHGVADRTDLHRRVPSSHTAQGSRSHRRGPGVGGAQCAYRRSVEARDASWADFAVPFGRRLANSTSELFTMPRIFPRRSAPLA